MLLENYNYDWRFDMYNQVLANQTSDLMVTKSLNLNFNEAIKNAGWTVVQSCDGVNISAVDDLWTSLSSIVRPTVTGGARSWQVYKSPEGIVAGLDGTYTGDQSRLWLVMDNYFYSVNDPTRVNVKLCTGLPTGGSLTVSPSFTSQLGGVVDGGSSGSTLINYNDFNYTYPRISHFLYNTKGHFLFFPRTIGKTSCYGFGVLGIKNPCKINVSGIQIDYPFNIVFVSSTNGSSIDGLDILAPNISGGFGSRYLQTFSPGKSAFNLLYGYYSGSDGRPYGYGGSNSGDMMTDITPKSALTIESANPNNYYTIGELTDFAVGAQGNTIKDVSGNIKWIRQNSLWIPANGRIIS